MDAETPSDGTEWVSDRTGLAGTAFAAPGPKSATNLIRLAARPGGRTGDSDASDSDAVIDPGFAGRTGSGTLRPSDVGRSQAEKGAVNGDSVRISNQADETFATIAAMRSRACQQDERQRAFTHRTTSQATAPT